MMRRKLEETSGYRVVVDTIEPRTEFPRHRHSYPSTDVLLSGRLKLKSRVIGPGFTRRWGPDDFHGYKNDFEEPAELLTVYFDKEAVPR